ncbi:MAG: winged helix-turn-helix domain-containing protein [Actinomycetota bacterium]|nr:winged helix-turn-helix domain-containing protein [Actinomycetota bacterium]
MTTHARVLLCVARDPLGTRLRDIAATVGITERAAHMIVSDLVEAGYLSRQRVGRRNYYEVHPEVSLRPPLEEHQLGELLAVFLGKEGAAKAVS